MGTWDADDVRSMPAKGRLAPVLFMHMLKPVGANWRLRRHGGGMAPDRDQCPSMCQSFRLIASASSVTRISAVRGRDGCLRYDARGRGGRRGRRRGRRDTIDSSRSWVTKTTVLPVTVQRACMRSLVRISSAMPRGTNGSQRRKAERATSGKPYSSLSLRSGLVHS